MDRQRTQACAPGTRDPRHVNPKNWQLPAEMFIFKRDKSQYHGGCAEIKSEEEDQV
jgi:hypothetical protein